VIAGPNPGYQRLPKPRGVYDGIWRREGVNGDRVKWLRMINRVVQNAGRIRSNPSCDVYYEERKVHKNTNCDVPDVSGVGLGLMRVLDENSSDPEA